MIQLRLGTRPTVQGTGPHRCKVGVGSSPNKSYILYNFVIVIITLNTGKVSKLSVSSHSALIQNSVK